jgi:hypothetical protein
MAARTLAFLVPALGAAILVSTHAPRALAQVISYESNGLRYQALSRGGVTIMIAPLPARIHDWIIYQVAITNGSPVAWEVKPEDFRFEREDGTVVPALAAHDVVETMINKASRSDASKLVVAYEDTLYGNLHMHSTNGYESRRQDALVATGSNKLKAAATASAIVLAPVRLGSGQSTDGAVFYASGGKPLGAGKIIVNEAAEEFVFPVEAELATKPSRR